ncbi:FolB domain protein [Ceratocystis lukuohia]|uniref:FolB domain protein n=1 Tax=Ceratocystis lukuohia TaxID=2019550 RepID=A0ABR4MEM9_9PEZI
MDTLWQVRVCAGEPTGSVKVTNLASTIKAGHDAWGRTNKMQPVSISVAVSLRQPFQRATATDNMADDTVHYGQLSKAILAALAVVNQRQSSGNNGFDEPITLRAVLDVIWAALTGTTIDGTSTETLVSPFLNLDYIQALSVSVLFPKASLLGSGVSLTGMAVYKPEAGKLKKQAESEAKAQVEKKEERTKKDDRQETLVQNFGVALKIHEMRVPTLIGLNDNERLGRQIVVTDVQIDRYSEHEDLYTGLEAIVQKSMDDSSFGTLEALASKVAGDIKQDFLAGREASTETKAYWQLKLSMTKPTAVPMAEGACVELVVA